MRFAQPSLPISVSALPFLFVRSQKEDDGWAVRSALAAAAAAERADDTRRNTRGRVAYLLCELGFQLRRRDADLGASLPLPRRDIADALGVTLCRVKRILALFSLSRTIEIADGTMRVLDWPRLAAIAHYDRARLGLSEEEDEALPAEEEMPPPLTTAAGDPAHFV